MSLKQGDPNAFDELFSLYGSRVFGFVFGYLKIREEAEEVVQEVFLSIWRNRKNLKPELSFKAYLFKIAYNLILEHFETSSKQQEYKHHIIEGAFKALAVALRRAVTVNENAGIPSTKGVL